MSQTPPALWVPPRALDFWEHRKRVRTVTLPSGERAKVTIDDSGTVMQIESGDRLDAVVRPGTVRIRIRPEVSRGNRR